MSINRTKNQWGKAVDVLAEAEAQADTITIARIDEASAEPRPSEIGETYVEQEYDRLSEEQESAWEAEGERAAREPSIRAEGLAPSAQAAADLVEGNKEVLDTKRAFALLTRKVLFKYRRREPGAKKWYLFRFFVLLLGDVAGIAGAAILRGEIVYLAIIQAAAAGTSAVTAGVVGADVRELQQARRRRRDLDDLSDDEREFAHFFQGPNAGDVVVRAIVLVAVTITLLVAVGIFALRASVDGALGGFIFGLLAAAICLASALNSWAYADEVADQIDTVESDYSRELNRHKKLASDPDLRAYNQAAEETRSIKAEFEARGVAAGLRYLALKFRVLRQNPGVFGHGPAVTPPGSEQPALLAIPTQANGHSTRAGRGPS
jgi:hypothetical protein